MVAEITEDRVQSLFVAAFFTATMVSRKGWCVYRFSFHRGQNHTCWRWRLTEYTWNQVWLVLDKKENPHPLWPFVIKICFPPLVYSNWKEITPDTSHCGHIIRDPWAIVHSPFDLTLLTMDLGLTLPVGPHRKETRICLVWFVHQKGRHALLVENPPVLLSVQVVAGPSLVIKQTWGCHVTFIIDPECCCMTSLTWIRFKTRMLVYKAQNRPALTSLKALTTPHDAPCSPWSCSILEYLLVSLQVVGWTESLPVFRRRLKTYLFTEYLY